MRIFLSSRYSRRDELCGYRKILQNYGHIITSRWLDTKWEEPKDREKFYASAAPDDRREEYAIRDGQDVQFADIFICFTDPPEDRGRRGGRHVELGIALALSKDIILVGPQENIFHFHSAIGSTISLDEFTFGLSLMEDGFVEGKIEPLWLELLSHLS